MSDKVFHLQPWSPKLTVLAQEITTSIKTVTPELEVLFMGSAALGLPGKNDIDLDILCEAKDVQKYAEKLIPILGKPKELTNTIAVWDFMKDGYEIDCILSDPAI